MIIGAGRNAQGKKADKLVIDRAVELLSKRRT
jgi:hypothetical protein